MKKNIYIQKAPFFPPSAAALFFPLLYMCEVKEKPQQQINVKRWVAIVRVYQW